jgi:formylglycine-generating enzyme required for sulfatase activity/dienelactone hydrolase
VPFEPGQQVGRYRVVEELGGGGMGLVFRAVDERLARPVALKVLRPEAVGDGAAHERFVREARAASALHHPNIVTVYDVDRVEVGGMAVDLIAMELVEGEPLDRRLLAGALPLAEALDLAEQLAAGLAAAHEAGLVHRDIKPGNLIVDASGRLRVLDFGLAKPAPANARDLEGPTVAGALTVAGTLVGTPSYMSPEQVEGRPLDARSDVFAAGVVLYELITGRRPFDGPSQVATLLAVVRDTPPPLATVQPAVPRQVARIVDRCLAKDAAGRYPSGVELRRDLVACRTALHPPAAATLGAALRRPRVLLPAAAALLAVFGIAGWLVTRAVDRRDARRDGIAELTRALDEDRLIDAFVVGRELVALLPEDPEVARLWARASLPVAVLTEPPGATVAIQPYLDADAPWVDLGTTPLPAANIPQTYVRWRVEKAGYEPLEAAPSGLDPDGDGKLEMPFQLVASGDSPPGMVRVTAGPSAPGRSSSIPLDGFWIDRHEVSNAAYQRFVADGGYRRPELWTEPFRAADGRELTFAEAIASFVDSTGRPGPATWQLGAPPQGQEDHPVGGVSWYEAAAFARWAGNDLPTFHHWRRAASHDLFSEILLVSNFGPAAAPVGSFRGIGPFGTLDMAGNVQEWCWSEGSGGKRYLVGGGWGDPTYLYDEPSQVDPLARLPNYGLRLARYDKPLPSELLTPIELTKWRDYSTERPVGDEVFAAYRTIYSAEGGPLDARVEEVDDSGAYRRERVSFAASYGGERVTAWLFLPRGGRAPHQLVVYFPDSTAEVFSSSERLIDGRWWDFLVRTGRAVLYPIYQGTYERRPTAARERSWSRRRDLLIAWSRDLSRSLDYVATRDDLDSERVAYLGMSLGANYGPVLGALEPRLKTLILLGGGLHGQPMPPEIDPFNFAPRVHVPVLMLNGSDDFLRPVATSQRPLFELLGTPPTLKRHALFPGGHLPPRLDGIMRETLDWLDQHLGPLPE